MRLLRTTYNAQNQKHKLLCCWWCFFHMKLKKSKMFNFLILKDPTMVSIADYVYIYFFVSFCYKSIVGAHAQTMSVRHLLCFCFNLGATSLWPSHSIWPWVVLPQAPQAQGKLRQLKTWAAPWASWSTYLTALSRWTIRWDLQPVHVP